MKVTDGVALEIFGMGMDRDVPSFQEWYEGLVLNLGAGNKRFMGTIPLDLPDWNAEVDPIPYGEGEVDHILAFHFLEHVRNIHYLLWECQRVLRPGGTMNIVVPYGVSDCAIQDLSHVHRFNEDTWKNTFQNPYYSRPDHPHVWEWDIGFNMIMGLVHRNLALVTQLIRR
jgi:predicted SAM-dependent methyltransferase